LQDRLHLVGLEPDLGVREAEGRKPCRHVRLIAQPVACLLRRRAVIAEAIRLHDQAQLGPVEIHLESVHVSAGLWL
jgi:hypothetical protein